MTHTRLLRTPIGAILRGLKGVGGADVVLIELLSAPHSTNNHLNKEQILD